MWNIHDGYPDWYLKGGNSMAHEMAHNEGRIHVDCSGGEADPDPNYPWPRPNCNIGDTDDAGWFGLEVYYTKWGFSEPAVIDNTIDGDTDLDAYPLLGYTRPRWVDPYTYCALLNRYGVTCSLSFGGSAPEVQRADTDAALPAYAQSIVGAPQVVAVVGNVNGTGDGGRLANVDMQNSFDVFQDTIDKWLKHQEGQPATGTFKLDVLSATNQLLHSQPVTLLGQSEEDGPSAFFELVPWSGDALSLVLLSNGVELDRRIISPNPPTVQVLEPGPGPVPLGPQTIRIRWQASDLDNDKLTFNVLYSPDNGQTWRALALGVEGHEYIISLEITPLPGSTAGLFRVEANDGFRTTFDVADVAVEVPGNALVVTIHNPITRPVLARDDVLLLDGSGEDMEDGRLRGAALQWDSSLDGILGTGEQLIVASQTLSPGRHTVTLKATDSDGATAAETVEVEVLP